MILAADGAGTGSLLTCLIIILAVALAFAVAGLRK